MVKLNSLKTLKSLIALFLLVLLIQEANAQNEVAIGSNTTKSNAILWLNGNGSQGLILPIVTNKTAVSAEKGMIVFDNSDSKVWYRNDNAWVEVGGGSAGVDNLDLQIQGNQLKLLNGPNELSTVNIAGGTATSGAFMIWTGTSWQYTTLSDVSGATGQVTGIKGKSVPTLPTTPQVLVYDGSAWTFQPLTGSDSQTLTFNSPNLSISNGNSVNLSALDKDAQTLSLSGSDLSISGGNTVTLPSTGVTSVTAGTGLTGGTITTTGTINVDVGTTANKIVQLDATGKLPAVDGSLLTNIPTSGGDITEVIAGPGLTGGGTSGSVTLGLNNSGITAGVYGSATSIPQMTVDAFGRITAVTTFPPLVADGSITGVKIANNTITDANILSMDASKITSGIVPTTQGGTGLSLSSGSIGNGQLLIGNNAGFAKANLTAGSGINITNGAGSITISSTNTGTVSNVTGTAPINVATGTSTPVISISQAGTTTNGYLSSADWNTFNNKGSGTVTSVSAGTGLSGGPITTTGSLSLANTAVTPGTYGTTLTIPQIAVDQQGRITSASNQTIPTANTTTTGLLSNTDWNTFNSKGNGTVTNVTGSGPISVATGTTTPAISITQAGASIDGFLSSADWTTFNSKQGALTLTTTGTNGAATLTGNILNIPQYTSSSYLAGTGLTLAGTTFSVNTSQNISVLSNLTSNGLIKTSGGTGALSIATPGTDYVAPNAAITGATATKITYDAKGLVTAGTSLVAGDIPNIAESQVTNLVTDLAGKQAQLNGTGFVKATGTTITYDNATYLSSETDPAVTAINGIVKSNGIAISAAVAGTDYVSPNAAITGATATKITYDSKGLVTAGAALVAADIPNLDASKITTGSLPIANGGTGATTAAGALTNLGALGTTSTAGGDLSGTFSNLQLLAGTVVDADVSPTAAIAGTKITPSFGTQDISTTGSLTSGTGTTFGTAALTWPGANAAGTLTNDGNGALSWAASSGGWNLDGNSLSGTEFLGSTNAQDLVFKTNNIGRMKINSLGNVSFATNPFPPSAALEADLEVYKAGVNSKIRIIGLNTEAQVFQLYGQTAGGLVNGWALWRNNSNESFAISQNTGLNGSTSSNQRLNISNTGNVAIGTSSTLAQSKLDVGGNISVGSGYAGVTAAPTDGAIIEGNVGIGTTNPGAKLEVAGQVKITGGVPGVGKVLTSDAAGLATWETAGSGWGLTGNDITATPTNFIGTTSNNDLIFKANNTEQLRIKSTGYITTKTNPFPPASTIPELELYQGGAESTQVRLVGLPNQLQTVQLFGQNAGTAAVQGWAILRASNESLIITNNSGAGVGSLASNHAMIIDGNTRNVWIGDVSGSPDPIAKLTVNGQIKINGGSPVNGYVLTTDANGLATWQSPGAGSGWGLTGNSGLSATTNFIGTTDLVRFNFRVNNQNAGRIDVDNVADNTSLDNTAFGALAINSNPSGTSNVAMGTRALRANTSGGSNVAIGHKAMEPNQSSSQNVAVGKSALFSITTGFGSNTAIGSQALYQNTTGYRNTAIGYLAGATVGADPEPGTGVTTGNNNTFVGSQSGASVGSPTALSNATAIGANAKVSISDALVLGYNANVGIGTSAPTQRLHVIGNILASGTITPSDLRYKKSIEPLTNALQNVSKLNGVAYYYRSEEFSELGFNKNKQIGVIAQEIEKVYPELVTTDAKGYKAVDYSKLSPILLEAIKELNSQNEQLKSKLQSLESENVLLESKVISFEAQQQAIQKDVEELKRILGARASNDK